MLSLFILFVFLEKLHKYLFVHVYMSNFVLTNKRAIQFFESNPHLDFNQINELFVDCLEKLNHHLLDNKDHFQNSRILQQLSDKLDKIETNQSTQIHQNMDSLTQNVRDMIKSNQHDNEKSIQSLISVHNDLFLQKIDQITQNNHLDQYISQEFEKWSKNILEHTNISNFNKEELLQQVDSLLQSKYSDMDTSLRTRMECNHNTYSVLFTEILQKLNKNVDTMDEVNHYFNKQNCSNTKGKHGETRLEIILANLFPTAEIKNTAGLTASGDFIINRKDKQNILIDTKDYDTSVPIKEIEKILRDMEYTSCHGILISQNSGIAQKEDFEINIHNNLIVIFIHKANYNADKIQLAVNIIDHLQPIISKKENQSMECISSECLARINKEYQDLVASKINIIQSIKKQQQDIISQIQKIDLPMLTDYLKDKFANTGKTAFHCERCNFIGKNAKSLAAHHRKCKESISVDTT